MLHFSQRTKPFALRWRYLPTPPRAVIHRPLVPVSLLPRCSQAREKLRVENDALRQQMQARPLFSFTRDSHGQVCSS